MTWTPIAKPTGTTYTNLNPDGKQQYDQASILYDDPNVFYDGINQMQWSNLAKPSASSWSNVAKPT